MRRFPIKKQRLREMSRAMVYTYDEHPYNARRPRVLRLHHLEDFPHPEHPYRTSNALFVFLDMFVKGLIGSKRLLVLV